MSSIPLPTSRYSPPVLRDSQLAGDETLRALILRGKRRLLTVAPTGAGKGTWLADLVRRSTALGNRCIFVVAGREIVLDFSRRLDGLGLDHGIIMGNHPRRKPWLNVHVASVDTLRRRNPPPADLLLFDEADVNINAWLKLIEIYPDAIFLGTTATPVRVDGRGLGELFEALVEWPQAAELMRRGYLMRPVLYGPPAPDMSKVHRVAGDFNQREVAAIVDRPKLTGDAVAHWIKHRGWELPTATFGVNRAHARHIQEAFIAAGYRWKYVDGETKDRQPIWDALENREIHGVSSVAVIGRGWDMPVLSCLIDLAPTDSLSRCLQRWGRVLRASPGKTRSLILDHAGNWLRHGLPDDPREWSLDGIDRKKKKKDRALSVRMCPECWAAFSSTMPVCPHCGWQYVSKAKPPEVVDGELAEITQGLVCSECKRSMPEAKVGDFCSMGERRCSCGKVWYRAFNPLESGWRRFVLVDRQSGKLSSKREVYEFFASVSVIPQDSKPTCSCGSGLADACTGRAVTSAERPAYTIRKLSHDPEIARLQKIAAERGYKPGWIWHQREMLREKRARAIAADVPQRVRGLFEGGYAN